MKLKIAAIVITMLLGISAKAQEFTAKELIDLAKCRDCFSDAAKKKGFTYTGSGYDKDYLPTMFYSGSKEYSLPGCTPLANKVYRSSTGMIDMVYIETLNEDYAVSLIEELKKQFEASRSGEGEDMILYFESKSDKNIGADMRVKVTPDGCYIYQFGFSWTRQL